MFYKKLKDKSTVISSRWKEIINQQWMDYYGFEITLLPPEIWREEKVLRKVDDEFKFEKIGLIRIPPRFNYDWHVDAKRGCSINMLLSHEKSYTFFSTPSPSDYQIPQGRNGHFVELDYEPDTFYAFNSQKYHCLYNFEQPRYLFSCEFSQPKEDLSYERLCKWIEQQ